MLMYQGTNVKLERCELSCGLQAVQEGFEGLRVSKCIWRPNRELFKTAQGTTESVEVDQASECSSLP